MPRSESTANLSSVNQHADLFDQRPAVGPIEADAYAASSLGARRRLNAIRHNSAPIHFRTYHPIWLILLTGCWIASVGNVALWRHLAILPELDNARGVALGVAFFVVILAGSGCRARAVQLAWVCSSRWSRLC